jgi:hypothetical protein
MLLPTFRGRKVGRVRVGALIESIHREVQGLRLSMHAVHEFTASYDN